MTDHLAQLLRRQSLRTRLLAPLLGLLGLSTLATVALFLIGTSRTRDGLLDQQVRSEADGILGRLRERQGIVESGARMLAADPAFLEGVRRDDLGSLTDRAVVVRNRFSLDLVQVFDADGLARINLVTAPLSHESSLLDVAVVDRAAVREVHGLPLLVAAARLPEGAGTVVTGIDLSVELDRAARELRTPASLALLRDDGTALAAEQERPDAGKGFERRFRLSLGGIPLVLSIRRATADIEKVTGAGLGLFLLGSLVTALLLSAAVAALARSFVHPIRDLAEGARAVAAGDLSLRVKVAPEAAPRDELDGLSRSFNGMVDQLEHLYRNLDAEVEARIQELAAAAEVARTSSSTLDLEVTLSTAADQIRQRFDLAETSIHLADEEGGPPVERARSPSPLPVDPEAAPGGAGGGDLVAEVVGTRRTKVVQMAGAGDLAGVPVVDQERLLGVIAVRSRTPGALGPRRLEALGTLAAQLAVSVRNARLYEASRREVREREKAEESARRSEERYFRHFRESLTGDFLAGPDGRILDCNPAFAAIFGFDSPADAVGIPLGGMYGPKDPFPAVLEALRSEKRVVLEELEMIRQDGKPIVVVQNLVGSFDGAGTLLEIQGYILDNSRLRLLEVQFLQAQKMEAVGRLAGGVAHDFNNLLTAILGYGQMLQGSFPQDDPRRRQAEQIVASGNRAAKLTRQLLAFSRKQVLQPRPLDVTVVVEGIQDLLRRLIGEDIDLVLDLQPHPGTVRADVGQLEQVLLNLAVNAKDAMPMGGRLRIETRTVLLEAAQRHRGGTIAAGRWAILAVEDEGVGMNEEILQHLFEPFFTSKAKGTGLGLATVHGIVHQSGGDVVVRSSPGKGSRFEVYLPLSDVESPAPAGSGVPEAAPLPRGTGTILLVEDDPSVRAFVRLALESGGYRVQAASGGDEALRMLDGMRDGVDLLLTDVIMNGMSGPELAKRVRGLRPEMRVLFMSGYTDDLIEPHGLREIGADLIQKPVTTGALLARVSEAISRAPPAPRSPGAVACAGPSVRP